MGKKHPNTSAWLGILSRVSGKQIFLMAFIELYFMVGCSKTTTPTSITPTITLEFPSATVIHRFTASVTATLLPIDTLTPPRPASTPTSTKVFSSTPTVEKVQSSTPFPTVTATPTETYVDPRKSLAPGQYVVFWRENTWYIQGLDGTPHVRLVPVESPNFYSGLSPDGEKVVFLTADDQIAVYDLSNGKLITYPDLILRWDVHFTWSPDSQILLAGGYVEGYPGVYDSPKALYVIRLQDGKTECLGCNGAEMKHMYGVENPDWSPDNRWIAFITGREMTWEGIPFVNNDLYLMDASCIEDLAACSEKAVLIDKTAWAAPKWSRNGSLASSCLVGDQHGICLMDTKGAVSPRMLVNINNLTELDEMLQDFDWSPDGEYLVFTVRYGKVATLPFPENAYTDVWVVPVQGGKVINLTNTPNEDEWSNGWSPDGEYVAFSRTFGEEELPNREGYHMPISEIYVVPAKGGDAINLTNTPNIREYFAFWMVIHTPFEPRSIYQITIAGNDLNLRDSPSLRRSRSDPEPQKR